MNPSETHKTKTAQCGVIVATPSARLAMQTALGLQEADLLQYFLTSYYYKKSSILTKIIEHLPGGLAQRLVRELRRRHTEGLSENLVKDLPLLELLFISLNRLPIPHTTKESLASYRNATLKRSYKRSIQRSQPSAVICCDGWAHDMFDACEHSPQTLKILDQNTGHITAMAQTLREEQELHPDMADSITPFSDSYIERCTDEALLADIIYVSSNFAKESLTAIGVNSEKIHLIEYGTDTDRFTPREKTPKKKIRFIFVGLIGQRKGVKYLLEAFKKLQLPDAELELVGVPLGSGQGIAPYRDLFIHTPSVPYHEIHQTFRNADIFVMPTLHESGVLAIHEALASGLPVITTPNAGSIVRDGKDGFVVPIRDIDALAEKMETLYRDQTLREEMSQNARQRALDFTWGHYRRKIAQTTAKLLG